MAHKNIDERRQHVFQWLEGGGTEHLTSDRIAELADMFGCSTSAIRNDISLWLGERMIQVLKMEPRPRRKGVYPPIKTVVMERDAYRCRYCNGYRALGIDHVIPLSQGGTDDLGNLVVCCASCNSRKGARTPDEAGMSLLQVAMADEKGL